MKILIADDDDILRMAVRAAVAMENDEVFECTNGQDAVAMYEKHKPDWVLMDIMMEPMDGLTATAKIKEQYPDARVIILTSYNQKEFEQASQKLGAVKLVGKDNFSELRTLMKF